MFDVRAFHLLGWAYMPNPSQADLDSLMLRLGRPVPMSRRGKASVDLRPRSSDEAPAQSMSAIVGLARQPLHTDGGYMPIPPRFLMMQCIDPGEAPCPTDIWSVQSERLAEERPAELVDPVWLVQGGFFPPFYTQVLTIGGSQHGLVRFDPLCMKAVSPKAAQPYDALVTIEGYATRASVEWNRAGVLLIDNWRCLHARSDARLAPSRVIRRWAFRGGNNGLDC